MTSSNLLAKSGLLIISNFFGVFPVFLITKVSSTASSSSSSICFNL
jgi:hypothetical protein